MGLHLWTPGSCLEFEDYRTGDFGSKGTMSTMSTIVSVPPLRGGALAISSVTKGDLVSVGTSLFP